MLGALSFASPLMLAALASLPLIWWILRATPPAAKEQQFPPFIILRKLANPRETPDRTPWWLLLLRLILTALVIIALAGPILNAPPKTPATGPMLIVLDDTYAAAHGWRARKDALYAAAIEAEQSDRTLYFLTTAPGADDALQPVTAEDIRETAGALAPKPFAADRTAARARLGALPDDVPFEIRWFADGVAGADDAAFAEALMQRGSLSLFVDDRTPKPILRPADSEETGPAFQIERLSGEGEWDGAIIAAADDGRELSRVGAFIDAGDRMTKIGVDLPLALRNEIASVRLDGAQSAGAVQLIDARDRRALVGLVAEAGRPGDQLLSGRHYLRQALDPHTQIVEDSLAGAIEAGVSVIILDDVGALRSGDVELLETWINGGGVLIRFAGPILAESAQDGAPPLLPVKLRGGGRAFGGALTWETPQTIDAFPAESPFAGLSAPGDAKVRRQVLAEPGGETTQKTWARLKDGTPLVTGARLGDGAIALFHVTATPQWSDIPLSGVFIDMLRRLVFLSAIGPDLADDETAREYRPLRLLDGYGRFRRANDEDPALSAAEIAQGPAPARPPGLYGSPDAPLALNVVNQETSYSPITINGVSPAPYEPTPPRRLAPPLLAGALALLLIDAIAALFLAGKLRLGRRGAGAAAAGLLAALFVAPDPSVAQPLDRDIDRPTADAALLTRLAYVQTGDPALDRLSAQALAGLSRELYRRTALEPGPPAAIDPETDDLSVYPFIYWPIAAGAEAPSETALANIENFMGFGGLILFDTRDDERAVGAGSTPESQALQRVLSQLNIPPLTTVDADHVLARSFYLLPGGLYGRISSNPVWVASQTGGANDGVTPVIIGGRDWAGAWAVDQFGRPVRPMTRGGPRARELAYRAGVNMVMVAFTGNYKSDQVHTPILLDRLGR